MIKHTQTIRRLLQTNCFSEFDDFVRLALKGLNRPLLWIRIKDMNLGVANKMFQKLLPRS